MGTKCPQHERQVVAASALSARNDKRTHARAPGAGRPLALCRRGAFCPIENHPNWTAMQDGSSIRVRHPNKATFSHFQRSRRPHADNHTTFVSHAVKFHRIPNSVTFPAETGYFFDQDQFRCGTASVPSTQIACVIPLLRANSVPTVRTRHPCTLAQFARI